MPPIKLRIHTDKGDFIVETENPADTPAGQKENARVTEEERRWKSLGIIPDDAGRPNGAAGPTRMQQLAYDIAYPSPGKQLLGDAATMLTGFFSGPKTRSVQAPEAITRQRVSPKALLDFDLTKPMGVLKDLFYRAPSVPVTADERAFAGTIGNPKPPQAATTVLDQAPDAWDRLRAEGHAAPPEVPGLDRNMPNVSGGPYPKATVPTPPRSTINLGTGMDPYAPNVSGHTPGFGEAASTGPSLLDHIMANQSGYTGEFAPAAEHMPPGLAVDHNAPNVSGFQPGYGEPAHVPGGSPAPVGPAGQVMSHRPDLNDVILDALDRIRAEHAAAREARQAGPGVGVGVSPPGNSPPVSATPPSAGATPPIEPMASHPPTNLGGLQGPATPHVLDELRLNGYRSAARKFFGSGSKANVNKLEGLVPRTSKQMPSAAEDRIQQAILDQLESNDK